MDRNRLQPTLHAIRTSRSPDRIAAAMAMLLWFLLGACNGGRVHLGDLTMNGDGGWTRLDARPTDGGPTDAQIDVVDTGPACQTPADCDDSDPCTTDICNESGHCRNEGVDCNDDDGCTRDHCDDTGQCVHDPCDANGSCTAGTCICNQGYDGDGFSCSDLDECTLGTDQCDPNATCTNTEGGYDCTCNLGYSGDGFSCVEMTCPDGTCSDGEDAVSCPEDCDHDLVVILPADLAQDLSAELAQYLQDTQAEGWRVTIEPWASGDASALKTMLWDLVDRHTLSGAWLIGELPAAWYEQTAFESHEEFPCDVFLESRDATWADSDNDGRYDSHSTLQADIFVSRLRATELSQYRAYFAKLHAYRTTGPLARKAAFLFFDDDWSGWAGTYGLDGIYAVIDQIWNTDATTKAAYLAEMTGDGAEFVYQWIHSTPTTLYVGGTGGGTISSAAIASSNLKGSFYNLYDCSASRFTGTCLALTYLTGTDYGLATVGTTKVGGMFSGMSFHSALADGSTWGEAFRQWYNAQGRYNDEWFLGMVILGDPLLVIPKDPSVPGILPPSPMHVPTARQMERLRRIMERDARFQPLDTFEDYQADHPEFFGAR